MHQTLFVKTHRLASQQVFYLHVAYSAYLYIALKYFVKPRNNSHLDGNLFADGHDALYFITRSLSYSYDDMINCVPAYKLWNLLSSAQNFQSLNDRAPLLARIIVNEPFNLKVQIAAI